VKTARFSDVVKKCGEPEPHLILMDPAKDRELQRAIKAKRVMTVFQDTVGNKADRGIAGFEPGPARQFLVFPKTLRGFEGKNIVGIKYDLWSTREPSKAERAAPARPPRKKPNPKPVKLPANVLVMPQMTEKRSRKKMSAGKTSSRPKQRPARHSHQVDDGKLATATGDSAPHRHAKAALKEQVRAAMQALEEGKHVAAFNILQRIVER
jgi:hypothetical protein